jgi:neutral ceramidase
MCARHDMTLVKETMMARTFRRLCCWTNLLALLIFCVGNAARADSEWKAGVARVETTPSAPVWMSGYASRSNPSQGVAHPLFAKALALANGQGNRVVLVTCDIIGFGRAFTGRVTDQVKEKYGLPRDHIALFASHCHSGPTPIDSLDRLSSGGKVREHAQNNLDYTRDLEKKLVALVGEALGRMQPVSLSYTIGRAHFALNRREPTARGIKLGKNPAGPTDESVPILRVLDQSGKPMAIVFGYACHNTTHRPDMMRIDPDYAGYAQDRIESIYPGATALFVTGCAGDADPHPYGTLDLAKEHGRELGDAVKLALDRPAMMTTLSGSLRAAFTEATIHFGGPTDRASYQKLLGDPNTGRKRHAQRMIEAIDQGKPIKTEYPYAVQAFALGNEVTLLALSGEVVVDYAIRLQKELGAGGHSLWVAAYANDVVGYIPSVRVLKEGGYEAGEAFYGSTYPAPLADDIEAIVVKTAHEMAEKVRSR